MAELDLDDDRQFSRLARSQKPMAILGALLALAGAAYLVWGVMRFDPRADPRGNPGFDWPVARLAFLFERGQDLVAAAVPQTPAEGLLLNRMSRNMSFSVGIMLVLLRIYFGTLAIISGFAILTVVVERARLIAMIRRLRE